MASLRSLPPPSKKRKTKQDSSELLSLEERLLSAVEKNKSLNPLADLVQLALDSTDAQETSKAIYTLYRVFVVIVTNGKLTAGADEDAKVVKAWIWERLNTYVEFLVSLLKDTEKFLRVSALQILFSLLKHLSTSATKASASTSSPQPQFHVSHFRKIVVGLLLCPPSKRQHSDSEHEPEILDADVRELFLQTWFSIHDDVRWFFLREVVSILQANPLENHPHIAVNLLSILEHLNTFPTEPAELNAWWVSELGIKPPKPKRSQKNSESSDEEEEEQNAEEDADDWRKFFDEDSTAKDIKPKTPSARLHKLTVHQSLYSLASHRAVFTRAWLSLLPLLSLEKDATKRKALTIRALNVLHRGVMPHLTRPVLIMDWVGASVDYGGTVGLLALNALFILMKDYNLDYPSFYTRLYSFLDRDVLHLRHRARFFRMTEAFLSSTHLPATLLASFIKRLSRLSLSAPPAAIIMIIPFTYNVLKRHPALMLMIHRTVEGECTDPFNALEPNPNLTSALDSSLWELYSHKNHYHSGVSTLAKIFEEAFTKPGYSMEDFLDHTYGTLFETEATRKIRKEPAMAIQVNADLFHLQKSTLVSEDGEDVEMETKEDLVSQLWTFGSA